MGSVYSQHLSYRPLTVTTFRWNVGLHGLSVFGFHLVNLLMHAVCSALVVLVARRVLREHGATAPLFAGLLFAVHPVHVEAVANIVCRAELLCCIFWCLAFLSYAAGVDATPLAFGPKQLGAAVLTASLSSTLGECLKEFSFTPENSSHDSVMSLFPPSLRHAKQGARHHGAARVRHLRHSRGDACGFVNVVPC